VSDDWEGLTVFIVNFESEGKVKRLEKIGFVEGLSRYTIMHMSFEELESGFLILTTKGCSLEAFLYDNQGRYLSSVLKHVTVLIASVQKYKKLTYFLSSIEENIFYFKFFVENSILSCEETREIETGITKERFSIQGMAMSKNKAVLYLVLFPQQNFDHLVLRQPLTVSLFQISHHDPHQILLQNPTEKFTDYYDCLEVVRFLGARDDSTLSVLEEMPYKVEISNKFLYYLK